MAPPEIPQTGPANSAGSEPHAGEIPPTGDRPPDDLAAAWAAIIARWSELREYASFYVAANVDRLRLGLATAVTWTILAVVLMLAALSLVMAASVLTVIGLSNGAAELLGGRVWAGQLLVGGIILATATGSVWLVVNRLMQAFRRSLVTKYELRKQQERAEYETDVEQRAQQRPSVD